MIFGYYLIQSGFIGHFPLKTRYRLFQHSGWTFVARIIDPDSRSDGEGFLSKIKLLILFEKDNLKEDSKAPANPMGNLNLLIRKNGGRPIS